MIKYKGYVYNHDLVLLHGHSNDEASQKDASSSTQLILGNNWIDHFSS